MQLNEAEIQVLASIRKAEIDNEASDRTTLEASGERYRHFREDWGTAYHSLLASGLIDGDARGYSLTPEGRPLAEKYHGERPDLYWYHYQKFYPAAYASETHSELCRRVFGEDLCQEGQTDMTSLNRMLELLDLKPGEKLLDLGCGSGVISEYISDRTGASVTGLDYAASAICAANSRTEDKRGRVNFIQGSFADMELAPESIDAAIAIDTLYWDAILADTVSTVARALKPGGRMGIFLNHHIDPGETVEALAVERSPLSRALEALPLSVETCDFGAELEQFWRGLLQATLDLRQDFEAEGNGFIAQNYMREAEEDHLPEIEAGTIARHLYIARKLPLG
jgi:SAM-dependent methyltransferase